MVVPELWQIFFVLVMNCNKTPDGCHATGDYVHVCSNKIDVPMGEGKRIVFKDNNKKITFYYGRCRLT
jgi:hypothetical protein